MKRTTKIAMGLLILAVAWIFWGQYPKLTMISGFAAKNMASTVWLSGRSADSVNQDDHQVPLISLAETQYDSTAGQAVSSVFGLKERVARCREGLGCYLVPGDTAMQVATRTPRRNITKDTIPYPFGQGAPKDTVFPEVDYKALGEALDYAFREPDKQRTRTLAILYKDHLISERYVNGFTPRTRILGWSMTKSVLATLYGILEYQGRLDTKMPTGLEEWEQDDRRQITYEDLLRMQSGLSWDEDYGRISDVTRMLFLTPDMAAVQAGKELVAAPGTVWNYSSGTSNLLSGMLRDRFQDYQQYLDFPYSSLIDRIGMHSMLLETDPTGTFVGSSYGWASTRDWARFGLLYLRRGDWDGQQIFSPDWVADVTRPTPDSGGRYGAHFWLNAGGVYPDAPRDLYSANGYQGQYVFIIPSRDLVIVRTGLAEDPDFDVNGFLGKLMEAFP